MSTPFARSVLRGIIRPFARFHRDKKGATAVEFAIIAVPFLGVLAAIFESTFVLFNAEIVDSVTANVSRQLMTGQIQTSGQSCAQQKKAFQDAICPTSGARPGTALPANFNCSKVIIDVRQSSTMSNPTDTDALYQDPTLAQFTPAAAGQNNIIRVIYPLPAILPVITGTKTSDISVVRNGQVQQSGAWTHMLMGIAVFRTEPFGGGGGSSC